MFNEMLLILFLLLMLDLMLSHGHPVCGPNQFFDPDSNMCDYCSVTCDVPRIQGTLAKCLKYCPGFLSTTESVTTTPPPSSTSSYSTLPTPLYTHLSEAEIAIVSAASVIVAVTSMVGVVIYNKQLSKIIGGLLHCQHVNKDKVKYPIQEVGARIVNPGTPPEGPQAPSSPVTSAVQPTQEAEPTDSLISTTEAADR